ncbi:hypothetical protein IGI04_034324 [Brassica rapa subsp. trilocularis]|uniref:peptidylprolyl isomerase n=1 Tax=Brassica rapa subsp. trilocularis TaxID=1813537 RepID=A0ABQ7L8D3_BRACM|nr:hypothetical protein IGI04_034324 [Brassica rapa subsp. trilocularis]
MIVAGFSESKKNHGNELIEKLEAGMQDMLQIVEDRNREMPIEEDMVEGFLYEVPEQYINMPFLKRRVVYMKAKIKDNPNLEDCVFHIVVDGYNAPVTAGNFVDLAERNFYNGMEIQKYIYILRSCGRIYRSNHREVRTVPLEIMVTGKKTPFYGSTLKNWVCTMAMARERELMPSNSNILDGRYDVFGGYVTQNEDFLADLKVDDVTDTSTILAALKYGRCSSTVEVEVRLLRFWEARNIKRGGHLMVVDMLLLDSKAMLIPAIINVNRLPTYRGYLKGTVIRAANPEQTSSSEDSSQEQSSPEDSTESQDLPSTPLTSENSLEKAESAAKSLAVADSKVFEAKEASQVADTAPKKSLTDVLKDENVELR